MQVLVTGFVDLGKTETLSDFLLTELWQVIFDK